MTDCIVYAAKSTTDEHGSIPAQLERCREHATRQGWQIAGEYQDEAASAYKGNRGPGLKNARAHAAELADEQGEAILLVFATDRLARGDGRNAAHLVEYVLEATKAGYRIESVTEDIGGEMALVLASLYGARAHADSKAKSEHTKAGMRRRAERGQLNGGPAPYGYRWVRNPDADGCLLVIDHAEAAIVERIFREYAAGVPQRTIAATLAREHVPAKRGSWRQGTVAKILRNPIYVGRVRFRGGEYPGTHERLIRDDLWGAVAELLEATARTKGAGRGRHSSGSHLFTRGLLRCGRCGDAMVPRTNPPRGPRQSTYEVYLCLTHAQDRNACSQTPIARELVDDAALTYFERVCLDVDATAEHLRRAMDRRRVEAEALAAQAAAEVADLRRQRKLIERDYLAGVLPAGDGDDDGLYLALKEKIEGELVAARAEAERLHARIEEVSSQELEDELLGYVAELREVVRCAVRDAPTLAAIRAALARMFERFELVHVPTERAKLPDPAAEIPAEQLARQVADAYGLAFGDYWLEPVERPEFVARWLDGDWPELLRVPLVLAANKDSDGGAR